MSLDATLFFHFGDVIGVDQVWWLSINLQSNKVIVFGQISPKKSGAQHSCVRDNTRYVSTCISLLVLIIFTIVKTMSLRKPPFYSILCTESKRKYICRVYSQLSQYIAKWRQITIDLCKSSLVTIETPRNHSLSQHRIVFTIVEKYIGIVTNIDLEPHRM